MNEIKQLISDLSMDWNLHGHEPLRDRAIRQLIEAGEHAIPYLIEEFGNIMRKQAKRLAVTFEDITGEEEKVKSGILLVLKALGFGVALPYTPLCFEGAAEAPKEIDKIIDFNKRIRSMAFAELGEIIKKTDSIQEIRKIEQDIGDPLFGSKQVSKSYPPDIMRNFTKLRMLAAKRKNLLAKDKGILLDDLPRPPKKGKIYQKLRRCFNGSY